MLMHGTDFDGRDTTGWLMSEKYDGFRAVWDGEFLYSRNGVWFMEPDWFTAELPAGVALDGELYIARNTLAQLNSRVRSHNDNWHGIRFMVFDLIAPAMPVEQRIAALADVALPAHCVTVEHTVCNNPEHLRTYASNIISNGGEGAMLRQPASLYSAGRTSGLLKFKAKSFTLLPSPR